MTREEKLRIQPIATSLIKLGKWVKIKGIHKITSLNLTKIKQLHFRIVSFADYVEDLGYPYMWVQNLGGLHFPGESSEVCVDIKTFPSRLVTAMNDSSVFVFSGCARGEFSECQPHGEHHEAAESTSPVPLGSAQAVCLFRCDVYQLCTSKPPNAS